MATPISPAGSTSKAPILPALDPEPACTTTLQGLSPRLFVGNDQRPQPRQQLHGYVSSEARDGWYRFAAAHGVNVTAMLEVIGLTLADHAEAEAKLPAWLRPAVAEARAIASSRSSRHRE